jgi:hypothetical protein
VISSDAYFDKNKRIYDVKYQYYLVTIGAWGKEKWKNINAKTVGITRKLNRTLGIALTIISTIIF